MEESGKNIFALIKVLDEQKSRETEGRMRGLVFAASKSTQKDMEIDRVFADGEVDKAWLTPESELDTEQE